MDVSNIIGSAVIVTQQTGRQTNPQQGQVGAAGTAADGHSPVQQQVLNGANGAHDAARNVNQESAASNDDANGGDRDKDDSAAIATPSNAAATQSNGIGANLNITA